MKDIIFLEPVFKDYIWGGKKLKEVFNKKVINEECTAESWEISTNKDGETVISNGDFKGKKLTEIYKDEKYKEEIFGTKCKMLDEFPILIKFIDAKNDLSVQVHPDNKYASENENSLGKTEMWYVLDCIDNAKIICCTEKEVDKNSFEKSLNTEKFKDCFNYINVKKGDCIFIPAGTIHAILGGILIAEIQQNSNITYRVYDWDRVDKNGISRELHIDKSLDVIDFNKNPQITSTLDNMIKNDETYVEEFNITDCEFFKTDKIVIKNRELLGKSKLESFYAMNVINGSGKISFDVNSEINNKNKIEYNIKKGDSFLMPSTLGEYVISGNLEILKTYI